MSSFVSENIYQSFTPLYENSFQLLHVMIITSHLFKQFSGDVWLVANVWLCVRKLTLCDLV
jgi:hypothetical protein